MIRLKSIKPKGLPGFIGLRSENGAHRVAVEWEEKGQIKEGVYILRRDTSLRINAIAGGRVFPGIHHHSKFDIKESAGKYHVDFCSNDNTNFSIDATETERFHPGSIFETIENASAFFESGSVGYSPNGNKYEGLQLKVYKWQVSPLLVTNIVSGFFEDETVFPKGSVDFDNALLMKQVEHEWHQLEDKPATGNTRKALKPA